MNRDTILALLVSVLAGLVLTSCGTSKTAETSVKADSSASVSVTRHDSIIYKEVATDRLIDHIVNNTYIVTPLGDTIGTKSYEKIVLKTDTKQTDSIRILQSRCDSLSSVIRTTDKEVVTTPLTWLQKVEIKTFPYVLVALLASIIFILLRIKK